MRGLLLWIPLALAAVSTMAQPQTNEVQTVIHVRRAKGPPQIDAQWDKPFWAPVPSQSILQVMGEKPAHLPRTEFKLAYDDEALYVIFRVEDRYVRSVTTAPQGPVYKDSCVEFFFTPRDDGSTNYFNLEINCCGVPLMQHHRSPRKGGPVAPADLAALTIASILKGTVDPERTEPLTWTVEYRLPMDALEHNASVARPAPGVRWRANFYKCADGSSRPHWITWAPIDCAYPDFHRPDGFGVLAFE